MRKKGFIAVLGIVALSVFAVPVLAASDMSKKEMSNTPSSYKRSEMKLHDTMRVLWEQHVFWTRMVIVDIVDGLASQSNDTMRLLKNYEDMEDALKPFYGVPSAEAFGDLMKTHLTTAAEFVTAANAGDGTKAAEAEKKWYANADDLATFLNKANPRSWSKKAVQDMLYNHLALTKKETVVRIAKDYVADAAAFDAIESQALTMADALSNGLMRQFPSKFSSGSKSWEKYREPSKATVDLRMDKILGGILVARNGMTLYTTKNDRPSMSNCYDACAQNWPPYTITEKLTKGMDIKGVLKTIKRTDGTMQVTYKNWPLYFWIGDKAIGDTTGNGVGSVWSVVKP